LYAHVFASFLLTAALLLVANVLTNSGQFVKALVVGAFASLLVFVFEFSVYRNINFYMVSKSLFIGGDCYAMPLSGSQKMPMPQGEN